MSGLFGRLRDELREMREQGVYKQLVHLDSPQAAVVRLKESDGEVINLCSNNYLGLCDNPEVVEAGRAAYEEYGAGTSSVRFICGTFTVHRRLEEKIASFLGLGSALTYVSCWNANTGLMPTFLDDEDALISDELNHASIIDSVRMTKSNRKIYKHSDMSDLERALKETQDARHRFVITDGVFSMEGDICRLPDMMELAEKYDAVVAIDDSHATGVLGETGRGTPEHYGMHGAVPVITSTLGKALGGAAGGFTAGPPELTDYLTQRSRPMLFSNALPPATAAHSLAAIEYLEEHPGLVKKLRDNTSYFREKLLEAGFKPIEGDTPIVPIIIGETAEAIRMSKLLMDEGVFVIGFGYPVVPHGTARIRCQISAAHETEHLDAVLDAMKKAGSKLGVI
ncbi:MAG: glycine C-acetyltransferase [Gemmatimonadetes bacterium]|uniref:Glycine C-acetyltransferase n=1 Tax=Candidatus Kutchimonas denitrificans TaxID=3056748 RepID=A0AAE4Z9M6_9BACT|nr:glycine C-acetyltransferase [Gemmatimonadota bacterium]NIR74706.1 glycine C-acetyltransferase [Candidatus Kutchimonas denitrificans]NIS01456.1 glycine C-acetyltransferase [Gemmatimonadota bacterium]NIT67197.1 glycine C-acetyltransferase [Gemmatimonadota bacterium]NIU52371.1 glycine C-acetyltransferase [Gemmatimonadota bacterium]